MNKKIRIGIITTIVIFIVGGLLLRSQMGNTQPSVTNNQNKVYCSTEGILTSTMPIQSHRSYCMEVTSKENVYSSLTPTEYSFNIIDDRGNVIKDFAITHTKPMHVIVVRKDLAYFQHVHPLFNQQTGVFTFSDLTFPTDGTYRIFADFAVNGGQIDLAMGTPLATTSFVDVAVGQAENYEPKSLGGPERMKIFDGYTIVLSTDASQIKSGKATTMTFKLAENGKAITDLEPYLGALGHSVVLREGNLDFIHAHPIEDVSKPQTGKVDFMVDFPESGRYKIFTQFQRNEKVITTDFVINVTQGSPSTIPRDSTGMHGGAMMH
jgi:hypothetical protein